LEKIKNPQKKMFRKGTTSRGHQRELARKGRHRSQLRVPTCGGMSTDGPQPTQGAPEKKKKKKGKSVGCFLGLFFCPLFSFSFFLEAPCFRQFVFTAALEHRGGGAGGNQQNLAWCFLCCWLSAHKQQIRRGLFHCHIQGGSRTLRMDDHSLFNCAFHT
jgi:hypothetical protein